MTGSLKYAYCQSGICSNLSLAYVAKDLISNSNQINYYRILISETKPCSTVVPPEYRNSQGKLQYLRILTYVSETVPLSTTLITCHVSKALSKHILESNVKQLETFQTT